MPLDDHLEVILFDLKQICYYHKKGIKNMCMFSENFKIVGTFWRGWVIEKYIFFLKITPLDIKGISLQKIFAK